MTLFLGIALTLSLCVILFAYLMDRSAVLAKINGANGLPILVALILSFLGSILVAILAAFLDGIELFAKILGFSVIYHAALGALLISRLQSLATQIADASRKLRK